MKVVTFGEIMLRLSPPGKSRFLQANSYDARFGGGEANVAVSLAQFGIDSRFVTALPTNDIGQACFNTLRGWGVDTSFVRRSNDRMGVYYLEHGAGQRPSNVVYDRADSAMAKIGSDALDWDAVFEGATWFHFTGITPALSQTAAQVVRVATAQAKSNGLTVSCDLNYRSKLWGRKEAEETMSELMERVDVCIANEEDAEAVFGIKGGDVTSGSLDPQRYESIARQLGEKFDFSSVAITMRESHSASRNGWSGLLYTRGEAHFSKKYDIDVVDRVGSGDAFAAGLIYGFLRELGPQETVEFATAAGCLKHSVPGDFNIATVAEVEKLAKGDGSGRVQR